MKKRFYAIKDKKLGEFMLPFWQPDDNAARVTVEREVKFGTDMLSKCPQDYALYFIFEMDMLDGKVEQGDIVEIIDLGAFHG